MSDEVKVKDLVEAILNPTHKVWEKKPLEEQENKVWGEFSLKQEVLPEGSVIIDEQITEISIIDLKGKNFKFPGSFTMVRDGSKITFKAT